MTDPSHPQSRRELREAAGRAGAAPAGDAVDPAVPDDETSTVKATSTPPTLDDLFTQEDVRASKSERKRNRRIGGWIALGVVVLLLGGLAAGGAWVWSNYED